MRKTTIWSSSMARMTLAAFFLIVASLPASVAAQTADPALVAAARKEAADVLAELAARSAAARNVHDSYVAFHDRTAAWSRISWTAPFP